jgi:hypothetical protein
MQQQVGQLTQQLNQQLHRREPGKRAEPSGQGRGRD